MWEITDFSSQRLETSQSMKESRARRLGIVRGYIEEKATRSGHMKETISGTSIENFYFDSSCSRVGFIL